MAQSITSNVKQSNSQATIVNRLTTRNFKKYSIPRSKYLPVEQFQEANNQKRIWIKAVTQECGLRGNEHAVLVALVYLTDPVNGIGLPSIGAIQEKVREENTTIHYRTVLRCLHRLQEKGAIIIQQRGKKQTNLYTLIGFNYKSESCYDTMSYSPNSSSLPKRREKKKSKKDYNNSPSAWADARLSEPEILKFEPLTDDEVIHNKMKMAELRKSLKLIPLPGLLND